MSMREVGGGAAILVIAVGFFAVKQYYRHEARSDRRSTPSREVERVEVVGAECLANAHALIDQAPNFIDVGPYLHSAVASNHAEVYQKCESLIANGSEPYRDAMLDALTKTATKDGRKDAVSAIDKLRAASKSAGAEWWKLKRKLT